MKISKLQLKNGGIFVTLLLLCLSLSAQLPVTDDLILHLDAGQLSLNDGDPVESWPDLSTAGNDVSQATSANRPIFKSNILNGLPVVRFDGTNDNLKRGSFTTPENQPNTFFVVWRTTTSGGRHFVIGGGTDSNNSNTIFQGTPENNNRIGIFGGSRIEYTRTVPIPFLTTTAIFDGNSGKLFENGVLKGTGNSGTNPMSGLCIGSLFNNSNYLNGDIAEILIYNSALSDTDREAVEGYLRDKWFRVIVYDGTTNEIQSWHATITGGIGAAVAGDRVGVASGTYHESLTISKPITIQGAGIGQSIIDGSTLPSATALVRIHSISSGNLLFDGFTIQKTPLLSTGGNRNPVMIHDCNAPAKITFTNNNIIGSGVAETGVNQWGLLAQFSTAEFVINSNTFDGIMSNAILIERAVGPVEVGHNTVNVPDYNGGTAIFSMSYKVGSEPWNVTGLHKYHNNIIRSDKILSAYGIRGGIYVASAWGTSWNQRTHGAYSNLVIENNKIEDITHWYSYGRAIQLEIDGTNGGFTGVQIKDNELSALQASTDPANKSRGIVFLGPITDTDVNGNSITDFYDAVILRGTYGQALYPTGVTINGNNLAENFIGMDNVVGNATVDATCNWWGTDVVANIGAKIYGAVNWSEFLVEDVGGVTYTWSGTDTYVCVAGAPYNEDTEITYITIQDAVDAANTGETVIVPDGTYIENVTLKDGVILSPGASPGCAIVDNLNAEYTGGTLLIDLWGDTKCDNPDGYDGWHVTNTVNLEFISLNLDLQYVPDCDKVFEIITSDNPIQNQFDQGTTITTAFGGVTYTFTIDYSNNKVTLTPALPIATAGGNATICETGSHQVTGASATNYSAILWEHNGAGSLSGETTLTPTYNAASGDAGETVSLIMTVTGSDPCGTATATANYTIAVDPLDSIARVNIRAEKEDDGKVKFTATPVNGGDNPTYQWFKNGSPIDGATENVLITTCDSGDEHYVVMQSSIYCAAPAESNAMCTY